MCTNHDNVDVRTWLSEDQVYRESRGDDTHTGADDNLTCFCALARKSEERGSCERGLGPKSLWSTSE